MSFDRYFKLSSYTLIASGYVAMAATGVLDLFSVVAFGLGLVASWHLDPKKIKQRLPGWALNGILLAYVPLYLLDYLAGSGSFILATIHLTLFVALIKLFTATTDRDYRYLYLISFAELLAAATLTIDITFVACVILFFLSGSSTLVLFEMKQADARAAGRSVKGHAPTDLHDPTTTLITGFSGRRLFWTSLFLTLGVLLISIPIFFLIPRVALGVYGRPSGQTQLLSGFSEEVHLGTIGTIKKSDALVMHVKLSSVVQQRASELKWRGVALDHYDGKSWSRSANPLAVTKDGPWFNLGFEQAPPISGAFEQTFYLEALSTNVVFAAPHAVAVSRDLNLLRRDLLGNLFTAPHPFHKIRYTVLSQKDAPRQPEQLRGRYLQVPDLDPRIAQLANRVVQDCRDEDEVAGSLESFLRNNYQYSLELPTGRPGADPLATFLFEARRGHCEYFASAMAVMSRLQGLPTRLVNGFRSGEYNPLGQVWSVRQYDAHSWVEVHLPDAGWVEFDPTPPDPQQRRSAITRTLSQLLEALDLWWSEQIIHYSSWKQIRLLRGIRTEIAAGVRSLRNAVHLFFDRGFSAASEYTLADWLWKVAAPLAAIAGVVFAIALLWKRRAEWLRRLSLRANHTIFRKDQGTLISNIYEEALSLLKSHGHNRTEAQTPLEFVTALGGHPVRAPLSELTDTYNRIRFSAKPALDDVGRARTQLKSLRQALREGVRPS